MENLPSGITKLNYKLKDGSTVFKYRVRRKTKTINTNKLFDTLYEAVDFLNTLNTSLGKALIEIDIQARQAEAKKLTDYLNDWLENPDLNTVVEIYLRDYLKAKDNREISKHNNDSDKSRLKRLIYTKIDITQYRSFLTIKEEDKEYKEFKNFKLSEITNEVITKYIEARIKEDKAKKTIQKELTLLNTMFNYVPDFLNIPFNSPIPSARKTALKSIRTVKRIRHIENEEIQDIKDKLEQKKNKEVLQIILLSTHTSLRRSEVIELTWSQIYDDYIQLTDTKNSEPRTVWLNVEAKQVISSIEKKEDQEKLFSLSILGFKSAWSRFKEENKIDDLKFHDFRKKFITDTIQAQIEASGIASVFGLGQALGVVDLDYFKKEYVDQEQAKHQHKQRSKSTIQTEQELQINSAHKDYKTQKMYVTKLTIPK